MSLDNPESFREPLFHLLKEDAPTFMSFFAYVVFEANEKKVAVAGCVICLLALLISDPPCSSSLSSVAAAKAFEAAASSPQFDLDLGFVLLQALFNEDTKASG